MRIYVDADIVATWERGILDLPAWIEEHHPQDNLFFPATVWQQLLYGKFDWEPARAQKRSRYLQLINLPIVSFTAAHAERAARLAVDLKLQTIGFADFQIAASALVDGANLLTFNRKHFSRVAGLKILTP